MERLHKMDEMSGMQELIIKKQGKVNALIADEKYLYFCIDSKHSRFYYRLFQIDLASGVCTSINNPVDLNTINEYVVCCYENAVYYITNEIDKNNNSIKCLNKTISSKKILGAKKKVSFCLWMCVKQMNAIVIQMCIQILNLIYLFIA